MGTFISHSKRKKTHALPKSKKAKTWTLVTQDHQSHRAGHHWDLRLVDPATGYAHSWAMPYRKLPKQGEKPVLLVRTPTHTSNYALNFGKDKPMSFGKGKYKDIVEITNLHPISVEKTTPSKVSFKMKGDHYTMFRINDKGNWLMRNTTKTSKSAAYQEGYQEALLKFSGEAVLMNKMTASEEQEALPNPDENSVISALTHKIDQHAQNSNSSETPINNNKNVDDTAFKYPNRKPEWGSSVSLAPDEQYYV